MADVTESPYTGLTASVKIGSGDEQETLAYISGADLTLEKDIIEILAFGMQFKEKVPAIKDWSLSLDGTVALASGGTQEKLYAAFDNAKPLTLGIYLDENTYFEGTGYVSSFNISAAPDDKINLTSEIAGSGATILSMNGETIGGTGADGVSTNNSGTTSIPSSGG
jgi:predicted secreted protein